MDGHRSLTAGEIGDFRYRPANQASFDFIADWVRPIAQDPHAADRQNA